MLQRQAVREQKAGADEWHFFFFFFFFLSRQVGVKVGSVVCAGRCGAGRCVWAVWQVWCGVWCGVCVVCVCGEEAIHPGIGTGRSE